MKRIRNINGTIVYMKRIYTAPLLQLVRLSSENGLMQESAKTLRVDRESGKTIDDENDIFTQGKHDKVWNEDE